MVYSGQRLDLVFGALADPTRRAIVGRLAIGETTVGELARPFAMSLPAVGKHLVVLERAHLVERWRDGRVRRVRLRPAAMREATAWLDAYRRLWDHQLDRLAAHLGESPTSSRSSQSRTTESHACSASTPPDQSRTSSASSGSSRRRPSASSRPGRPRKS